MENAAALKTQGSELIILKESLIFVCVFCQPESLSVNRVTEQHANPGCRLTELSVGRWTLRWEESVNDVSNSFFYWKQTARGHLKMLLRSDLYKDLNQGLNAPGEEAALPGLITNWAPSIAS